jgi:hypothetical protein
MGRPWCVAMSVLTVCAASIMQVHCRARLPPRYARGKTCMRMRLARAETTTTTGGGQLAMAVAGPTVALGGLQRGAGQVPAPGTPAVVFWAMHTDAPYYRLVGPRAAAADAATPPPADAEADLVPAESVWRRWAAASVPGWLRPWVEGVQPRRPAGVPLPWRMRIDLSRQYAAVVDTAGGLTLWRISTGSPPCTDTHTHGHTHARTHEQQQDDRQPYHPI